MKHWFLRLGARAALTGPLSALIGRGRRDPGLDRQTATVLELNRLLRLPAADTMTPEGARRFVEEGLSVLDVAPAPMHEVNTTVPGPAGAIPIRIYVPHGAGPSWIVYLHGGGGVIGSIRASDPVARYLAAQTRCTVASIDYRLGPEHPHPAAIEDACAAWDRLLARIPAEAQVAVAGDSFGGYLAAHVDRHARASARPPDLQVLIYPVTDLTLSSPSIERNGEGYLLTKSLVQWFRDHYLRPDEDRRAASPAFWPDLDGASPAIVITAGFDPLVDDGDAHAARLRAAGALVAHHRHEGLVHGFLTMAGAVQAAQTAVDAMCADVARVLASPGVRWYAGGRDRRADRAG